MQPQDILTSSMVFRQIRENIMFPFTACEILCLNLFVKRNGQGMKFNTEDKNTEYKSIQKIRSGDKGFKDLAGTCVALANAQGGKIYIGIDNKTLTVGPGQAISAQEQNDAVSKLRSLCFSVAITASDIMEDENGSQYFIITVYPSTRTIASTSDGKLFVRIVDKCEPVRSEDIQRLAEEKGAYQWEINSTRYMWNDPVVLQSLHKFADDIRESPRVKDHIKQLDDIEIAENYHLIDGEKLTNLGVLWLGTPKQRANICYPLTVQYIVYNSMEEKVRKEEWHDLTMNPMELLLDVERKAIELTYSYEFPNGLYRKEIRHYNPKLLRELLVNAFAHKSYTISNDITIKVFTDRLEIANPGGLPLGISKENILHTKHRRNPNMIEIMSAYELMEGEGSGYDLIYELNAKEVKLPPEIESSYNEVKVTQRAEIIDAELLPLLDFVMKNYQLTQKSFIAFGIIARERKILSTQLTKQLQLTGDDRLRSYVNKILSDGLIIKSGNKKATQFQVNPKLIQNAKVNIKTSLKTIEPHVLETLIQEDVAKYPGSKISEISSRIPDVTLSEIRKIVYSMVDVSLVTEGARTNRRYFPKTGIK